MNEHVEEYKSILTKGFVQVDSNEFRHPKLGVVHVNYLGGFMYLPGKANGDVVLNGDCPEHLPEHLTMIQL